MESHCGNVIVERRPDIVIVNKMEKAAVITDFEILGDQRMIGKEKEKTEKYQNLKREILRLWILKKIDVIPAVLNVLGSIQRTLKNM